jgi:hypothetical protein
MVPIGLPARPKGVVYPKSEERSSRMKSRKKQRENRRMKAKEERIEYRNMYGYQDPTPYLAVRNIMAAQKTTSVQHQPPKVAV